MTNLRTIRAWIAGTALLGALLFAGCGGLVTGAGNNTDDESNANGEPASEDPNDLRPCGPDRDACKTDSPPSAQWPGAAVGGDAPGGGADSGATAATDQPTVLATDVSSPVSMYEDGLYWAVGAGDAGFRIHRVAKSGGPSQTVASVPVPQDRVERYISGPVLSFSGVTADDVPADDWAVWKQNFWLSQVYPVLALDPRVDGGWIARPRDLQRHVDSLALDRAAIFMTAAHPDHSSFWVARVDRTDGAAGSGFMQSLSDELFDVYAGSGSVYKCAGGVGEPGRLKKVVALADLPGDPEFFIRERSYREVADVPASLQGACGVLGQDADSIYASTDDRTYKFSKTTGASVEMARRPSMRLALGRTHIYLLGVREADVDASVRAFMLGRTAISGNADLVRVPKAGGTGQVMVSRPGVSTIATSPEQRFIYWVETTTSDAAPSIMRLAKTGGEPEVVVTASVGAAIRDLLVDDDAVYWLETPGGDGNRIGKLLRFAP